VNNAKGVKPAQNVVLLPGLVYTPSDIATKKSQVWGCN
jgi:hypothetical protein